MYSTMFEAKAVIVMKFEIREIDFNVNQTKGLIV